MSRYLDRMSIVIVIRRRRMFPCNQPKHYPEASERIIERTWEKVGISTVATDPTANLFYSEGSIRFETLLDQAARISPELRLRFTSPHPKDFPDDLLHVSLERSFFAQNTFDYRSCAITEISVNPFICLVKAAVQECSVSFCRCSSKHEGQVSCLVRFDASWIHERSLSLVGRADPFDSANSCSLIRLHRWPSVQKPMMIIRIRSMWSIVCDTISSIRFRIPCERKPKHIIISPTTSLRMSNLVDT